MIKKNKKNKKKKKLREIRRDKEKDNLMIISRLIYLTKSNDVLFLI